MVFFEALKGRQNMCEIAIRADGGDFLLITLSGRSHPDALDFWDGNWIRAHVEVKAGGFRGDVQGDLRSEEFVEFEKQLSSLQNQLRGQAEFHTMESMFSIEIEGDGKGHMECRCVMIDNLASGNKLDCTIYSDQTFTRQTLADLQRAIISYPVMGSI